MTIAFAARFGDCDDVALALLTPATICVCRADQRADAATKLGYSSTVFDRVNNCDGPTKYKTVFNPPTRGGGGRGRSRGAAMAVPAAAGPPRHTPPQRREEAPLTALSTSPPQPYAAHSSAVATHSGSAAHGSAAHGRHRPTSPWPLEPPRAAATNGCTPPHAHLSSPPRRDLHPVPPPGPPAPPHGETLSTDRRAPQPVAPQRRRTAAVRRWRNAANGPPAEHSSAHGIAPPAAHGISSRDDFDSIPRSQDAILMQSLQDLLAEPQADRSVSAESAFERSHLPGAFHGVYAEEWWRDGGRSFGAASPGAYDAGPVGGAAYVAHPAGTSSTRDADLGGGAAAAQWADAAFTTVDLAHMPPFPAGPTPAAEGASSEAAAVATQEERDAFTVDVRRGAADADGPLRGVHLHSARPGDEPPPAGDAGMNRGGTYVPHLRRPECWPVPTAVALGSSAPTQLAETPAHQPPTPVPAPELERDVSMAGEFDDWRNRVDTEVDTAPFSAFMDPGLRPGIFAMAGDSLLGAPQCG